MLRPRQALRLFYISWVLARHGLDDLLLATHLFRPVRFLRLFLWWNWFRREGTRGERIRRALEDLGPIFVKFGQILSTRRDLLPDDIALELMRLQDRVPPFSGELSRSLVEKAYRQPVEEVFGEFTTEPMASASIAQVHAARLKDGRDVVVKVLRPDIAPVIRRDISLMYIIARKMEQFWTDGRRLRPLEVVGEFERTILDELDLMREAANASQIRRNFENSPMLYIPEVHWPLCRRNVMVMERVYGIPIADMEAVRAAGVDMKMLAERGVEIFFTQVFRHNFFHADMHPGNIFVEPGGRYISVDFGIVGSLSVEDQRYLAENLLAFFKRDYNRVAVLHVESGWVPAGTRVDEFEAAIRTVCEPIFQKPFSEISFGNLLLRLFQTARRFNMEVQPQLVLLQKTLLNIEGLGRQIDPQLDLWTTAKPFLERWMSEQVGVRSFMNRIRNNIPAWGESLPEVPQLAHEILQKLRHGSLQLQTDPQQWEKLHEQMRTANRRNILVIIGSALVVSAAVLLGLDGYGSRMLDSAPLASWGLGLAGVLLWFIAWPRR